MEIMSNVNQVMKNMRPDSKETRKKRNKTTNPTIKLKKKK